MYFIGYCNAIRGRNVLNPKDQCSAPVTILNLTRSDLITKVNTKTLADTMRAGKAPSLPPKKVLFDL